jgi:hypothetical protein
LVAVPRRGDTPDKINTSCQTRADRLDVKLIALLGHVSAERSLRYRRPFDATVRADYETALTLAKTRLGPVGPNCRSPRLPSARATGARSGLSRPIRGGSTPSMSHSI